MTAVDHFRIGSIDWSKHLDKFKGKSLFRSLTNNERENSPYTHAIKEGADGHCPFLVNNLCFIHANYGAQAKPSICQLFPYCFNETPSGVYASVSFVSMGVIHNSGRALSDQRDLLENKLNQFHELFPNHHPNWSQLKLTVDKSLDWQQYLSIEENLITFIKDKSRPIDDRLLLGSQYLMETVQALKPANNQINAPEFRAPESMAAPLNRLNAIDNNLLMSCHRSYFPNKPMGKGRGQFGVANFINQILAYFIFPTPRITLPQRSFSLAELTSIEWPTNNKQIDDLLDRYFYCRIFSKFYFAAGFGQLSLVTGFHHLILLLALIKLQARALACCRNAKMVEMEDVVPAIRQLEKRLGEVTIGNYAAALLELLLYSPARTRRLVANCR